VLLIDAIGVKVSDSRATDSHVNIAMSASIQELRDVLGLRLTLAATSPQRSQTVLNLCADGSLDQGEAPHVQETDHRGFDRVAGDFMVPDLEFVAKFGESGESVFNDGWGVRQRRCLRAQSTAPHRH